MIKQSLYLFIFLLSGQPIWSQTFIKGKVVSEETGKPLSSVSVYLNNTTKGTVTDDKGLFIINRIPPGKFRLVASSIGYETYVKFMGPQDVSEDIIISLKPKPEQLKNINVIPFDPDGWEKWGKLFMRVFIGSNPNSYDCVIENFGVLRFRLSDNNALTVFAGEPIRIRNNALGYEIKYKLEDFEFDFDSKIVSYSGYALFTDLSSLHPGKALRWIAKRTDVYDQSLLHFMRAFFVNHLGAEGFEIRSLAKMYNPEKEKALRWLSRHKDSVNKIPVDTVYSFGPAGIKTTIHTVDSTGYYKSILLQPDSVISRSLVVPDSIGFAADSSTAGMYSPDSLEVTYKLKNIPAEYKRLSKSNKEETYPVSQFVFLKKQPVYVISSGYYYGPYNLKITGYWAWWETMSTMLPYDYEPVEK
jgi:hypothetical protein